MTTGFLKSGDGMNAKDVKDLTIKAGKAHVFKRGMKGRIIYIACI